MWGGGRGDGDGELRRVEGEKGDKVHERDPVKGGEVDGFGVGLGGIEGADKGAWYRAGAWVESIVDGI